MKILVLDDERNALEMMLDVLKEAAPEAELYGFRAPKEALAWAEKNAPVDVAFLDIQMRGITGLSVAKQLKQSNPKVNVIFSTGYSEYAVEACNIQTSGYLLKPVSVEKVRGALEGLLYPVEEKQYHVYVRTFGSFEVFVNGEIVHFGRSKAKEMLAYLVDRHGCGVSRKEIFAVLFGDDPYSHGKQAYLTNIIRDLQDSLAKAGVPALIKRNFNSYAVDTKSFFCDLYDYEAGDAEAINSFHGEYMLQYSWAEETLATLYY